MSEFKVGDRVRIVNEDICGKNRIGKICKKFLNYGNINRNLYEVDVGATYPYEIFEEDLELYEEKEEEIEENKKLITLDELLERIEKLEKEVFKPVEIHDRPKETKPSLLTEDERVILRNLDKDFKWIARDGLGNLIVFKEHPFRGECTWLTEIIQNHDFLQVFNHLFKFIKWEDEIPYNIEELLKGECGNE